jgi:hypothetical protein
MLFLDTFETFLANYPLFFCEITCISQRLRLVKHLLLYTYIVVRNAAYHLISNVKIKIIGLYFLAHVD